MAIQSLKSEKTQKEDCLAIFKPGLWQTSIFRCGKEWYHFQQELMVSKMIVTIINSTRLACVRATSVAMRHRGLKVH